MSFNLLFNFCRYFFIFNFSIQKKGFIKSIFISYWLKYTFSHARTFSYIDFCRACFLFRRKLASYSLSHSLQSFFRVICFNWYIIPWEGFNYISKCFCVRFFNSLWYITLLTFSMALLPDMFVLNICIIR